MFGSGRLPLTRGVPVQKTSRRIYGTPPNSSGNKLAAIIKRKQEQIAKQLYELGMDGLEEKLKSATEAPSPDPYRLSRLVAEIIPSGRPVLAFEVVRDTSTRGPDGGLEGVGEVAARLCAAGADVLVVPTDLEDTHDGLRDLFAVRQAAGAPGKPSCPVLQRDWFIHPLQIVEAKEAGCAGIIGVVASVSGARGTPVLSSFAASLGLDCPVEVVNLKELRAMETSGVPFYGLNISVGLSVTIAGFGADVTRGLLGELPFAAASLAGARSMEEAAAARSAGADAILLRGDLVSAWCGREQELVATLKEMTCGDD